MCSEITIEDTTYHYQMQLHQRKFSYTWSIDNFWTIYKFVNKLYLRENQKYFGLYVSFSKDHLRFFASANCSTLRPKEYIIASYSIFFNSTEGEIMHISKDMYKWFVNTDNELLYELPISLIEDNKHKYLPNETLTICFKFIIFNSLVNHYIYYSHYPKKAKQSFIPDEECDSLITFVIDGKRLQANKALLCLKSKVFEAMFNCGLRESTNNEVEITDIKYDILQQMLFFLQTGYLSVNVKTDTNVASELIIAAEKYDLKKLKLICEEYLIINTTKKNVIEHLKFAHLNNATVLKNYALSLIKLHLRDFMDTPNFITLVQEYHELLLQIQVTEIPTQSPRFDTAI